MTVQGIADAFDLVGGGYTGGGYAYQGNAAIASGGFAGDFELGSIPGTWNGQFFGPSAREVGAVFRGSQGPVDFAGSLVGSSDIEFRGIEPDLLSLNNRVGLSGFLLEGFRRVDAATGNTLWDGGNGWEGLYTDLVNFDPVGHRWMIRNTFTHGDSTLDASNSDSAYLRYGDLTADANGVDGLTLLKPGAGNPVIELSYMTFGAWENAGGAAGEYEIMGNMAVFGIVTADGDRPTTGTAGYSGVLFGVGKSVTDVASARPGDVYYSLGGTTAFTIDFASGRWSGSINPVGRDRNGPDQRDFGVFAFANGSLSGTVLDRTDLRDEGSATAGGIWGQLFGPQAAEAGGGFTLNFLDPLETGHQVYIDGLFAATKD